MENTNSVTKFQSFGFSTGKLKRTQFLQLHYLELVQNNLFYF